MGQIKSPDQDPPLASQLLWGLDTCTASASFQDKCAALTEMGSAASGERCRRSTLGAPLKPLGGDGPRAGDRRRGHACECVRCPVLRPHRARGGSLPGGAQTLQKKCRLKKEARLGDPNHPRTPKTGCGVRFLTQGLVATRAGYKGLGPT